MNSKCLKIVSESIEKFKNQQDQPNQLKENKNIFFYKIL